jgi:predicted transposase YbfD/YdcC
LKRIQRHWCASEDEVHYRRDVSFEEDRCRVKNRQAAETLAVLRNLPLGLEELERDRGKSQSPSLKGWMKQ